MSSSSSSILLLPLLLFTTLTTSAPAPLLPRAGGPAFKPLDPSCSVTHPVPASTDGKQPSPAFASAHGVYSAYFSTPQYSPEQRAQNCIEQCNGFAGCVAAVMADRVPTPKGYYGTAGGALETACLFFDERMTAESFVDAVEGQYVGMYAANIQCPP